MNTRAELLALRRQHLLAECLLQRADLAGQLEPLEHTLDAVDASLRIIDRVRRHPGWIAAAALGLVLIRPRRLSSWLRLGTTGLRTWRAVAPGWRMLLPH